MAILGRDQILNADDRKTKLVPVPEWGGEVLIRSLTGKERDEFESAVSGQGGSKKSNLSNFRARLVSLCIVNEKMERLFVPADIPALGNKSVAALQRVFNACNELNAITEEDVENLTEDFDEEAQEASTSD